MPDKIFHIYKDYFTFELKVNTRSSFQKLVKETGKALKLCVKSAPTDGKANKEIIKFFSKKLKIPQACIIIIKGLTSKEKTIKIYCEKPGEIVKML